MVGWSWDGFTFPGLKCATPMSLEAQTDQTPNGAANVRFHLMLSVRPDIRFPNQFRTLSRVVRCARFSSASHTSCLSRTRMRELVYHQVLLGVCVSVCVVSNVLDIRKPPAQKDENYIRSYHCQMGKHTQGEAATGAPKVGWRIVFPSLWSFKLYMERKMIPLATYSSILVYDQPGEITTGRLSFSLWAICRYAHIFSCVFAWCFLPPTLNITTTYDAICYSLNWR